VKTEVLSKEELIELLAACNNLLMRGLYHGEDAVELGDLMHDLNAVIDHLAQEVNRE
jgi:hypothetical protein